MEKQIKILLLILVLQLISLVGQIIINNSPTVSVVLSSQVLPSNDYALIIDDLDEEEKAAFCNSK